MVQWFYNMEKGTDMKDNTDILRHILSETSMNNIDILRRILSLLEDYSFEDDVSLEENILLKRLQTKVNTMMEDYVEDFKA